MARQTLALVFTIAFAFSIIAFAFLPYISGDLDLRVDIHSPGNGDIFHHRDVTIYGTAYACCNDKLVHWKWIHTWSNGSKSEENMINYDTIFEFHINVSLYPGRNDIVVTVKANSGREGEGNITLYYDGPVANSNGPYNGGVMKELSFSGSAYGGYKPYNWHWDFGDGNISNERNPEHVYREIGVYEVTLTVTDSMGYTDVNHTMAIIGKGEENPPSVEITKPSPGIYVNDKKLLPYFIPLIIGNITIEAEATDDTGIASVEFYIDDNLLCKDSKAPYEAIWKEETGIHKVEVIAYDFSMNSATDSIKIISLP